jgi:hypothetical protein
VRIAFLTACCGWGVLVVLLSEAASSTCALTGPVVTMSWWAACAVLLLASRPRATRRALREAVERVRPVAMGHVVVAIALTAVLALVAMVALWSAPNTWDGHGYHLARVRHWIQNRSIGHFPTNIERQNDVGPWAELAILQLDLLTGGDRLAAFVQWWAMMVAAVASSVIAWNLGASRAVRSSPGWRR